MNNQHITIVLSREVGFTLIELLIALAIVSIIVTMGSIAITNNLKQMESKNVSSILINFLTSAKQDALVYQNSVTACVASDALACVKTGGTQLISFFDKNNNHSFDVGSEKLNNQIKLNLSWGSLTSAISLNKAYIIFRPESARPIGYIGNIQYCPSDGNVNNQFKVSFNETGIIKHRPYAVAAFNCR